MDSLGGIPDDFLAAHEFARSRGGAGVAQSPERRLMLEVLTDAVRLVVGAKTAGGAHAAKEAREWIADDSLALFGYSSVCEALGIDKEALRVGIREWIEARDAGCVKGKIARRRPADGHSERVSLLRYRRGYRRTGSLA